MKYITFFIYLVSLKSSNQGALISDSAVVYAINVSFCFRASPAEVFMDLVLTYQALEKAERLALVFGLNHQQLLEFAGDLKLSAKEFPQAISLYKVSRVCKETQH
jgi:hypothetical protein